ncbi:MAG: hypothetical protein QXZ17_14465 [Nitrososphaerota archaeon]
MVGREEKIILKIFFSNGKGLFKRNLLAGLEARGSCLSRLTNLSKEDPNQNDHPDGLYIKTKTHYLVHYPVKSQ